MKGVGGGGGGGRLSRWFSECVKCVPFECFYFHGVSEMMR